MSRAAFIRLPRVDGTTLFINCEHIISVSSYGQSTPSPFVDVSLPTGDVCLGGEDAQSFLRQLALGTTDLLNTVARQEIVAGVPIDDT